MLRGLRRKLRRRGRPDRRTLLKAMPSGGVCAEVGVWKGDFSREILRITRPRELHLIDPWRFQSEFPNRMYGGKVARSQEDMDRIFEAVRARFSAAPAVRIHRGYSEAVLATFEDESLDWIYIDGNHYYDYVLTDLRLSWRKVKPGGYVAGDDYTWTPGDGSSRDQRPVQAAVRDLLEELGANRAAFQVLGSQFLLQRAS